MQETHSHPSREMRDVKRIGIRQDAGRFAPSRPCTTDSRNADGLAHDNLQHRLIPGFLFSLVNDEAPPALELSLTGTAEWGGV